LTLHLRRRTRGQPNTCTALITVADDEIAQIRVFLTRDQAVAASRKDRNKR
jgi:hypothetical protein